jgi:hypothetical protein
MPFYYLTKHPDLHPAMVREQLIEPLFASIEKLARPHLRDGYLSWAQLRARFVGNPLATLADHTWQHDNLAALGSQEIGNEVRRSHAEFTRHAGSAPRWFTVPFGRFTQRLAADLITPVQELGYHGVLWVGEAGNIIRSASRAQLSQLVRLHAPDSVGGFAEAVQRAAAQPVEGAVWQVHARAHARPVRIVASSRARPVLNFEMLMRQGKDYASDPGFYRYLLTGNPDKGDRPDYYAVTCEDRIEATAYNFHSRFWVGGQVIPGVYIASWRKLPQSHRTASGLLIRRMTHRECVVGAYKPSALAEPMFRDWHSVTVWRHVILVPADPDGTAGLPSADDGGQVVIRRRFEPSFTALAEATIRAAGFTVARDATYYSWRFDTYPLARHGYFHLIRDGVPAGYCAVLWQGEELSIADFPALALADMGHLVAHALGFARARGLAAVTLETSSPALSAYLSATFGSVAEAFRNYYHLNDKLLAARGVSCPDELWAACSFHETAATGDVLLR